MLTNIIAMALRVGGFTSAPPLPSTVPTPQRQAQSVAVPSLRVERPALGLHTACVRYARAIDSRTWAVKSVSDRREILNAMGCDLSAWQRVQHLLGRTPWRAGQSMSAEEARTLVRRTWNADLDSWEAALRILDRQRALAVDLGKPAPHPLHLPVEVRLAIEGRRAAALERAKRRERRSGDGGSTAPVPVPEEDVTPPLAPRM